MTAEGVTHRHTHTPQGSEFRSQTSPGPHSWQISELSVIIWFGDKRWTSPLWVTLPTPGQSLYFSLVLLVMPVTVYFQVFCPSIYHSIPFLRSRLSSFRITYREFHYIWHKYLLELKHGVQVCWSLWHHRNIFANNSQIHTQQHLILRVMSSGNIL